jgi:hypothetical protein
LPYDPRDVCTVLERIARSYQPDSDEYRSVELAARALLFIHADRRGAEFTRYLEVSLGALTEEQRRFLSRLGLEPG